MLDKPAGPSSAQCLAKIKRLGQKKIGHAGTLDPMASGVLLVLLGQATKLSSYLLSGGRKIYSGLLRLGVETDTWDAEGDVVREAPWRAVTPEDIAREINSWPLLERQDVPAYSAAKHEGQPLYRLARNGKDAPKKTKDIKIYQADMLESDMPWIRFRVVCGSGVYIRSLAHSLGKRLGCGATLFELTREYSHPFGLADARGLTEVLENPGLLPATLHALPDALPDWPRISLSPRDAARIRNGIAIAASSRDAEMAILLEGGRPLALARLDASGGRWTVARGLWN